MKAIQVGRSSAMVLASLLFVLDPAHPLWAQAAASLQQEGLRSPQSLKKETAQLLANIRDMSSDQARKWLREQLQDSTGAKKEALLGLLGQLEPAPSEEGGDQGRASVRKAPRKGHSGQEHLENQVNRKEVASKVASLIARWPANTSRDPSDDTEAVRRGKDRIDPRPSPRPRSIRMDHDAKVPVFDFKAWFQEYREAGYDGLMEDKFFYQQVFPEGKVNTERLERIRDLMWESRGEVFPEFGSREWRKVDGLYRRVLRMIDAAKDVPLPPALPGGKEHADYLRHLADALGRVSQIRSADGDRDEWLTRFDRQQKEARQAWAREAYALAEQGVTGVQESPFEELAQARRKIMTRSPDELTRLGLLTQAYRNMSRRRDPAEDPDLAIKIFWEVERQHRKNRQEYEAAYRARFGPEAVSPFTRADAREEYIGKRLAWFQQDMREFVDLVDRSTPGLGLGRGGALQGALRGEPEVSKWSEEAGDTFNRLYAHRRALRELGVPDSLLRDMDRALTHVREYQEGAIQRFDRGLAKAQWTIPIASLAIPVALFAAAPAGIAAGSFTLTSGGAAGGGATLTWAGALKAAGVGGGVTAGLDLKQQLLEKHVDGTRKSVDPLQTLQSAGAGAVLGPLLARAQWAAQLFAAYATGQSAGHAVEEFHEGHYGGGVGSALDLASVGLPHLLRWASRPRPEGESLVARALKEFGLDSKGLDEAGLRKAYRARIREEKAHPDFHWNNPAAEAKADKRFKELTALFEALREGLRSPEEGAPSSSARKAVALLEAKGGPPAEPSGAGINEKKAAYPETRVLESEPARVPETRAPESKVARRPAGAESAVPQVPGFTIVGNEPVRFGGEGEIWDARDDLGRRWALKRGSGVKEEHEAIMRVRQEQRDHPGLQYVIEPRLIDAPNGPVLVMPFIQERLSVLIDGPELLSPGQYDHLLAKVRQGIDAIHKAGMIHADLTPSNILVVKDPRTGEWIPTIVDFGLSVPSGTRHKGQGKVDYASANQDAQGKAKNSDDDYSLHKTLQQLEYAEVRKVTQVARALGVHDLTPYKDFLWFDWQRLYEDLRRLQPDVANWPKPSTGAPAGGPMQSLPETRATGGLRPAAHP